MLEKHALMILGKRTLSQAAAAAAMSTNHAPGRCANVIPVIKAGLHSLQLDGGGEQEFVFFSYLIKTGTYIAAELSTLFQECASVIQQHRMMEQDHAPRNSDASELTALSPFLLE